MPPIHAQILALVLLLALYAPARVQPAPQHTAHAWISIPRLGLDHLPLPANIGRAALFGSAQGTPHLIRLPTTTWLYALQAPKPHERPAFGGDEVQLFWGSRNAYKPRARFYVARILDIGTGHLAPLLRTHRPHWRRHGLLLAHCDHSQCVLVLARTR